MRSPLCHLRSPPRYNKWLLVRASLRELARHAQHVGPSDYIRDPGVSIFVQGLIHLLRRHRQVRDTDACGVKHSVDNSRGYSTNGLLANRFAPRGRWPTALPTYQDRRQVRDIAYVRDLILAKGQRGYAPLVILQLFHEGIANALHYRTLDLP